MEGHSKLIIKTLERRHQRRSGILFVDIEYILLVLPLWNASKNVMKTSFYSKHFEGFQSGVNILFPVCHLNENTL